jgi:hypothetical protein
MLTLPLSIVISHILPTDRKQMAEQVPGTAMAFSTAKRLLSFMGKNVGGEWKMQMADDRDGLVILIAELHRLNIRDFVLDSENGEGGEAVTLTDLVVLADSLN